MVSDVSTFREHVPDCVFPKQAFEDGEMGMIAPNEWLLSAS
jgi:hypothetical protein